MWLCLRLGPSLYVNLKLAYVDLSSAVLSGYELRPTNLTESFQTRRDIPSSPREVRSTTFWHPPIPHGRNRETTPPFSPPNQQTNDSTSWPTHESNAPPSHTTHGTDLQHRRVTAPSGSFASSCCVNQAFASSSSTVRSLNASRDACKRQGSTKGADFSAPPGVLPRMMSIGFLLRLECWLRPQVGLFDSLECVRLNKTGQTPNAVYRKA